MARFSKCLLQICVCLCLQGLYIRNRMSTLKNATRMVESGVELLYVGEQKLEISLSFKGL